MAFLAGLAMEQDTSMKELWGKLKGIYTYGQPMVISSNMKCVQECHNRIGDILFRHVYQNDIVPLIMRGRNIVTSIKGGSSDRDDLFCIILKTSRHRL